MKARYGIIKTFTVMMLVFNAVFIKTAAGQVAMGILPVNAFPSGSPGLDTRQLQTISTQMHEYLVAQLSIIGEITKLSREHVLLLIKEMSSHTPENLDIEAYKQICRKENLDYLLKCSVETCQIENQHAVVTILVIILDGNSGKDFWTKSFKSGREITRADFTVQTLMDEIFKPEIDIISQEIITLKF